MPAGHSVLAYCLHCVQVARMKGGQSPHVGQIHNSDFVRADGLYTGADYS